MPATFKSSTITVMSTNTIESLLGSSQSQCRAEMLESQGDTPRKKDEVGRLQRRVRTFKGSLTTAITSFISYIEHYEKSTLGMTRRTQMGPPRSTMP